MDTTAKQVIASAKVKKNIDWAISSEAAKELVERPTTRKSNPERMKFPRTGSFFFTMICTGNKVQVMSAKKLIADKKELEEVYGQLKSMDKMAKHFNVSKSAIALRMAKHGIKNLGPRKKFFATKAELGKVYTEQGSLSKAAKVFNVSKPLVAKYLKKYGIATNLTDIEKNKLLLKKLECYPSFCEINEVANDLGVTTTCVRENAKKLGKKFTDYFHDGKSTKGGYVTVYDPSHPSSDHRGYVKEHRVVMEKHLGRYIDTKKEVVHHIDHNKLNNSLDNLQLMSPSEHSTYHVSKYWNDKKKKKKI